MFLRPHHLLCIRKFTGHGYDAAFTAHMTETVTLLRNHPETAVTLICGADELCTHCPHHREGICDSQQKVAALDAAVLRVSGLHEKQRADWQTLANLTSARILHTDNFSEICACCEWFSLCRETEEPHGTITLQDP